MFHTVWVMVHVIAMSRLETWIELNTLIATSALGVGMCLCMKWDMLGCMWIVCLTRFAIVMLLSSQSVYVNFSRVQILLGRG